MSFYQRFFSVFVLLVILIVSSFAGVPVSEASTTTLVVTKTVDTADGVCDSDCSLREAITEANNGTGDYLIELSADTYTLSIPNTHSYDEEQNLEGDLDIFTLNYITIEGVSSELTIIEGGGAILHDRVLDIVVSGGVELRSLTITNGDTSSSGGGVSNRMDLLLDDVVIEGNFASYYGGGLYSSGTLEIISSSIINNSSAYSGAGAYFTYSDVFISDSVFADNSTLGEGGGIASVSGELTLLGSKIDNNSAYGDGGGIYCSNTFVEVLSDSSVSGNDSSGYGGGVYNDRGEVFISYSELVGNAAQQFGGGIVNYDNSTLEVRKSLFGSNASLTESGGAIWNFDESFVYLEDSVFLGNDSSENGGAVSSDYNSKLEVVSTRFEGNSSGEKGGAVYNARSSAFKLIKSILRGNQTGGDGGALYASAELEVDASLFWDNQGDDDGGAIFNSSNGVLNVLNSTFYGNSASVGGVLYNLGDVGFTFGSLISNEADSVGGVYSAGSGVVLLKNTLLQKNLGLVDVESCEGGVVSMGWNLEDGDSCGFTVATHDQVNTDARLAVGGPKNNGGVTGTIALLFSFWSKFVSSPAINVGDCTDLNGDSVKVDQRGVSRDSRCDIGAYEVVF